MFDSGTTQKKYFFARARRNWQTRAAYSAGATNRPRPSPGDFEAKLSAVQRQSDKEMTVPVEALDYALAMKRRG
jgi:hypothetical protein